VLVYKVRLFRRLVGIPQKYSLFYIFKGIKTKLSKVQRELIVGGGILIFCHLPKVFLTSNKI